MNYYKGKKYLIYFLLNYKSKYLYIINIIFLLKSPYYIIYLILNNKAIKAFFNLINSFPNKNIYNKGLIYKFLNIIIK